MNKNTIEALQNVLNGANFYLNRKYGDRKRLTLNETFEKATMIRDIQTVKNYLKNIDIV